MSDTIERDLDDGHDVGWNTQGEESFVERMSRARAVANPEPTVRLQCPTLEHGEGVMLFVAGASGTCHCGRKLRTLAPWEILANVEGRVVPVAR